MPSRKADNSAALCPHCLTRIGKLDNFCPNCDGPLTSHANTDPMARIRGMGHMYERMFPTRGIHPLGRLGKCFVFGLPAIVLVVMLIMNVVELRKNRAPGLDWLTPIFESLVVSGVCVVGCLVGRRVVLSYLDQRKSD